MNISFLWVRNFRNFENFGLNLSSSSKFKYNIVTNTLSYHSIPKLPDNFFGPRIKEVVAIIGKNGAGKSNAVELVCKSLKGAKTSLQSDIFIITEEDGRFVCHYSLASNIKPEANFEIDFKEYEGSINPLKVVFFSNVFDERRNDFDNEVSDISVNNLFSRSSSLRKDRITDFEKQIRLINSKLFPTLNIDLPTKVQLTSKVWTNRLNSSSEREIYGNFYESIRELKKLFRDRIREIRPENKLVHLLRFGFFFELFYNSTRRSRFRTNENIIQFKNVEIFIPTLFKLRTEEISEKLIEFLEKDLTQNRQVQQTLFTEKDKEVSEELSLLFKQIDFLKKLKSSLSELKIDYNTEGARNRELEYFFFDYKSNLAKGFINEYITLFGQLNDFSINWIGISSGHKAYINLFASLYQELRYTRQDNLLLCIDEGDLYLHPRWQIEFFDKLLNVLSIIYSGDIQLILTSHSPFLLSDLPNQNITILDKDMPGSTLDGTELETNTFGGNLYNLYSEPFFLGNKRTSDFAYNKIKEIIELAEKQELSRSEKRKVSKIINLLGDEIIQFRIKKILKDD